jgi:choline dehydrogenase-like flavoprotein
MLPPRVLATIVLVIVVLIAVVVVVALTLALGPIELDVDEADVLIVGGGTAACVLARRLSEYFPRLKIVVLERGVNRRDDPIVYNVKNMLVAGFSEPYSELLPTDFPGAVSAVAKMYGGGSSHNFSLAVRGSRQRWEELSSVLGVSYDELLSTYFPRVEAYHPEFTPGSLGSTPPSSLRFRSGMMQITPLPVSLSLAPRIIPALSYVGQQGLSVLGKAFTIITDSGPLRASDAVSSTFTAAISTTRGGVPIVDDYNTDVASCTAASPQLLVDSVIGIRQSTDVAYLPSSHLRIDTKSHARSHRNKGDLQFVPGATVTSVSAQGAKWRDVEGKARSTRLRCTSSSSPAGRVIVSAGGIYTPYLLQRSGFSIPRLGEGLKTHYGFSVVLAVEADAAENFSFSSGPVSFVPRTPGEDTRDWQFLVEGGGSQPLIDAAGGVPGKTPSTVLLSLLLWNLRPRTTGTIGASGEAPTVNLRLFGDGDTTDPSSDASSMVDAMRWIGQHLLPELSRTYPSMRVVFPTQAALDRDDPVELLSLIRQGLSLTDHYSCTCAMGTVVDPQTFLLSGTSNIHVVDASVAPGISDGNTCYPTIVYAEIAADRIAALL